VSAVITVEKTTDESYIKSVFLNPIIYTEMKDDSCPSEPAMLGGVDMRAIPGFFLRVLVGGEPGGAFWLIWKDRAVEAHTALLHNCRGRSAIRATEAGIRWVFENTKAEAITSYAWSDSPLASWLCRAVGMQHDRTEPWPATRNGKPVDIAWFTINRPKEAA
jgi:hypothetical protein